MKRILMFAAGLFLLSCGNDVMVPLETPINEENQEATTMEDVSVPIGFSFESVVYINADIALGESFTAENVKIKIYQIYDMNEELIYDGFVNRTNAITDEFLIPNHVEDLKIIATYAGIDFGLSRSRDDLSAILEKEDFSLTNGRIAGLQDDYVFCEDGGSNGTVEIYQRVLVIKGSNKDDELDVDRNGSKTKVILKTDGDTRVDTQYDNSDFDCIFIYLDNGDDKVQMGSTEKPSLINLGNGSDEITASDQAKDIIYGGNGKDKLIGKYHTDELIGGNSKDDIDAGSGGIVTDGGSSESCDPLCYSAFVDEDGDGFQPISAGGVDVDDDNPNVVSYGYPQGQGVHHSLVFEDLWPCKGDYDFNDLVVNYTHIEGKNGNGNVTEFDFSYKFPAIGGYYNNAAVLRVSDIDDNATLVRSDDQDLNIERRHDSEMMTTLFYFENLKSLYTDNPSETVNCQNMTYNSIPEIIGKVTGVDGDYDIFMVANNDLSLEVHSVSGYNNLSHSTYRGGSVEDKCSEGQFVNYKTDEGYPWALSIPTEWSWPKEGIDILQAYPDFEIFVETDQYYDWYSNANLARKEDKIIQ